MAAPSREQFGPGLRVTFYSPYAIYYRPLADAVVIIRVLHGARDVTVIAKQGDTAEGRSRAKARGQHTGIPALTPQQQAEARQRQLDGTTFEELADSYNVGIATIARLKA